MRGQADGERCAVPYMAARAWGFAQDAISAEVVNGMDILAAAGRTLIGKSDCADKPGTRLSQHPREVLSVGGAGCALERWRR